MVAQPSNRVDAIPHRGLRNSALRLVQREARLIWILAASVSLLTARYLLVESNLHYPLLLYFAQMSAAAILAVIQHSQTPKKPRAGSDGPRTDSTGWGYLMGICAMGFSALAMVCLLQAILHNKNLPTLVMLTVIALFIDDVMYLLLGYAQCSRVEVLRISALLLACIGILIVEYRLSVPSLVTSISAMVFAGTAGALRRAALQRYTNGYPKRNHEYYWLLGAGSVIVAIWILFFWRDRGIVLRDLNHIPFPLIVVNIVATTIALLVGRSTIFPMDVHLLDERPEEDKTPSLCDYDTFALIILAGIAGCSTMVGIRRSYTNWSQYCCFAIAIVCGSLQPTSAPRHTDTRSQGDDSSTYELLEDSFSTSAEDEETGYGPNDTETTEMNLAGTRSSWMSVQSAFQVVTLLVIWSLAITMNYGNTRRTPFHASMDRSYEATTPLEIVLSMYSEPIDDVKDLISGFRSAPETGKASVTIYTKHEKADTGKLKTSTGADKVIKLPNVGREGETYLHHIISRWDSLAKHTIYLQADVHFSRNFYARLKRYFDPDRTGFLGLGWATICNCEDCGDQFYWKDSTQLFPKYHSEIYNSTECGDVLLSYKGEFMASAARTRGINKGIYEEIWHAFTDENSWAHQPGFLRGRPDSMNDPHLGYTMERMWSLLFQCSDMEIAWRCPSLMSEWRLGGDVGDCQCFDATGPIRMQGVDER